MAYIMLADGTCFYGVAAGKSGYTVGELVFNTSHQGYQEILTDPSYLGQIINFTAPHVGNVGINPFDNESKKVHAAGAVFRCLSQYYDHWQASGGLHHFLLQHQLVAISEIDTRALTLHLREHGSQGCCIVTCDAITPQQALASAREKDVMLAGNAMHKVTSTNASVYAEPPNAMAHIAVVDCGVKTGILQVLACYPIKISVLPASVTAAQLNALKVDGVLVSNGPGDPQACHALIDLCRQLLAQKMPLFGICLGHQILALAAGTQIKKMKFGHHGANHPIQCLQSGQVFISSQNHNFVVDEDTLPPSLSISHRSLFDGTIAGIKHRQLPAFSFQGHPEAGPGPQELALLFNEFIKGINHA